MRSLNKPLLVVALSISVCGAAVSAVNADGTTPSTRRPVKPQAKATEPADATRYWYDGERRRTLRVDPQWVADFGGTMAPAARAPGAPGAPDAPGASDKAGTGAANSTGTGAPSTSARSPLKRATPGKKASAAPAPGVSEVLRDESGSPRALPGGVIVRMHEADLRGARDRLVDAGLRPVRPLDPEGRSWLVEAPAGLESLELANRLHESGRFASASPNWWRPRALK